MSSPTNHSIDDPAADAAMLLLRVGLSIIAMAVPITMPVSRWAVFILLPVGSSIVLLAGVLLSDVPIRRRIAAALFSSTGICGLALIGWGALSLVWSPVGPAAIEKFFKTAGTLLLVAMTVAFLPERTRTSNLNLFPLGILGGVVVTLFCLLAGPGVFAAQAEDSTLQRAIVTLVVLVWPALGAMAIRGRWTAAVVVVFAVMIATLASWSAVALAALGLGAVAFVLATSNPARVGRAMGLIAAALILLGPVVPFALALILKPVSLIAGGQVAALDPVLASLRFWADLVVGDPLRLITGHGLDMATIAPTVGFLPPETPRSLLFEIWYDFGVIGAVLGAVLVHSAFGMTSRLSVTVAPFLLAELMAMLTIAFAGLETTQVWWVTMAGVVTLAFATVMRGEYRTNRPVARLEPQIAPLPR